MTSLHRATLSAITEGVAAIDGSGAVVSANSAFVTMVGWALSADVGTALRPSDDRDPNEDFFDALRRTKADGQRRQVRHQNVDAARAYDAIITQFDDLTVVEAWDTTADVAIDADRARVQAVQDIIWSRSDEHFLVFDVIAGTVETSPSIRGWSPVRQLRDVLASRTLLDYLDCPRHYDEPWTSQASIVDGRVERAIAEVFTTGQSQRHRHPLPLPDGSTGYVDTTLTPWAVDGRPRGVVMITHDVTEIVRAERRSRIASEAIYEILENLPVEVWEFDLGQGTFTRFSASGEGPAASVPVSVLVDQLEPGAEERIWQAVDRLSSADSASIRLRDREGNRWMQSTYRRVPQTELDSRQRVVVVVTDVTSEVASAETQGRLDHANHVMRFAQGVAHDFGNVAQVVGGYAEILQRDPTEATVSLAAKHLASAAQRGVAVSRRIATIARVQQVVNVPVDVSQLVLDSVPHLQELVGGRIEVTADITEGLIALAEPAQVVSALENLCGNAVHAMEGRGEVFITVDQVSDAGRRFVQLAVTDNGPGVPAELIDRVFDPFVTGRPDSGTGLGLYLIQEYLFSLGGEVRVESSDEGATFRLLFPAVTTPFSPGR